MDYKELSRLHDRKEFILNKMKELFEQFCEQYNLDYVFTKQGNQYLNHETQKAYIIFKYSANYRDHG